MEVDDGGDATTITQRQSRKKLRCGESMYRMREGNEREGVFKI